MAMRRKDRKKERVYICNFKEGKVEPSITDHSTNTNEH